MTQEQATFVKHSLSLSATSRLVPLSICASLLAAFFLRSHNLAAQSFWYDEAFSVYLGGMDLPSITALTAADIHPPLYYYLLHFWLQIAGSGEFAVRYISLFFGVLTVPVIYKLGQRFWGDRWPVASHVVAWLASLSPAYIWYGQEARMYTLAVFFSVLGIYAFAKIAGTGAVGKPAGRLIYVCFIIANMAAAYAHFYALFVVAAEAIFAIGALALAISKREKEATRPFSLPNPIRLLASIAVVALSYLPWSGYALTRLGSDKSYYAGTIDLWTILRESFSLFSVGQAVEASSAGAAPFAMVALAAAGSFVALIGSSPRRSGLSATVLVLLSLVVPIILLYAISYNRPKFHPRYLLIASPAFYLLVGAFLAGTLQAALQGYRAWSRRLLFPTVFAVSLLSVVVLWLPSLGSLYSNGGSRRDDWRAVAAYVGDRFRNGDAVILISGHAFPAFGYYYSASDWTPLPEGFTLSTDNTLGYNIANTLNHALKDKDRLWVVRWQADVVDPNGYLNRLLSDGPQRLPVDRAFAGIDVQLFAIPQGTTFNVEPGIRNKANINFDNKLKLLGYELRGEQSEKLAAESGNKLPLTLYWQATTALEADYVVSLRVKDGDGHEWGRVDRRPANYFYPTQRWKPGEIVFGDYDVPVLAGTPPGSYYVEVEVYSRRGESVASLNVLNHLGAPAGNASSLAEVNIDKSKQLPSTKQLMIPKAKQATFGDIALLGFEEIAKGQPMAQGSAARLMLFWQALRQPPANLDVVIQMADATGSVFYEKRFPPARRDYPTTQWRSGELARAQYDILIPPDAPAGKAQLRIAVADASGLIGEPVAIQTVEVTGRKRQVTAPSNIQVPKHADLGGVVTFLGYDLERDSVKPGGVVRLTLYWQAVGRIERSLAVFTHLLDGQEQMWGQKDSVPAAGTSPTTGWIPGEVTEDVYEIPVKPDAPDGALTIEIGMYDQASGERLVVDGKDNRILLGQVRVAR